MAFTSASDESIPSGAIPKEATKDGEENREDKLCKKTGKSEKNL